MFVDIVLQYSLLAGFLGVSKTFNSIYIFISFKAKRPSSTFLQAAFEH